MVRTHSWACVSCWATCSASRLESTSMRMLLAVGAMLEGETGVEVIPKLGIGELMTFSLLPLALYPPAPHFQIFVLNFAIRHGNSGVSAFISSSAAAHRSLLASNRLSSPTYLRILGRDP